MGKNRRNLLLYEGEENERMALDEEFYGYRISDDSPCDEEYVVVTKKKKKKKKEKREPGLLEEIDNNIYGQYKNMVENIKDIQYRIEEADRKATRKVKAKALRNNDYCVPPVLERLEIRKRAVNELECNGIFDTVTQIIKDLIPIAKIIGRLVASLIVAILSVDRVKLFIKPKTLSKMDNIMKFALSI